MKQTINIKRVSAGEVLTVALLRKIDKAAYQYGGFQIEGSRSFSIVDGKVIRTLPTAKIERKYIKMNIEQFVSDFSKTMNAAVYNIEIV